LAGSFRSLAPLRRQRLLLWAKPRTALASLAVITRKPIPRHVQRSTWKDLGFDRMNDEIAAAFGALVDRESEPHDPDWSQYVWKRRRQLLRWFFRQQLQPWRTEHQRNTAAILDEYDPVWGRGYDQYSLHPVVRRQKPWIWGSRRYWSNSFAATRFRQVILARVIERVQPRRVLEVGCGNGINLLLLACRFPNIEFVGLELTSAGRVAVARFQAENQILPAPIQAFAPLPLSDPAGFRRICFVQGSASDLPFADGAFDLTMTVLALEQMERIRNRALSEIARVTAGHAFLLEPFREFNNWGWRRFNQAKRDYFAGRVKDLPEYGLTPEFAIDDYPQEAFLHTCAVLCRKRGANEA
jgi:SAM-dependent methyltransferase